MFVKKLYLDNFLSYGKAYVEFGKGLNVIEGANAAGKTNLVESIYFSSLGKPSRTLRDKELINWADPEKGARIKLLVERKYSDHTVDTFIDGLGKKRIMVDNLPISKIGELLGAVNVVFFSPSEMRLIKESPADRRRFIDINLCQRDKLYYYTLVKYNKLLAQRNKVFKTEYNSPNLKAIVKIITDKMVDCEEYIITRRREMCEELKPLTRDAQKYLTDNKETLSLTYETEQTDAYDIRKSLVKLYDETYEKDVKFGYTTVGIHRDDLKITVDDTEVRKYGSQGQQRTSALSLKLAELEIFRAKNGEYPVLILDDVLSELDEERQKALLKRIDGVQTLITTTGFDKSLCGAYTRHEVKNKEIITSREGI